MKRISMLLVLAIVSLLSCYDGEVNRYCGIGEVTHTSETIYYSDKLDTEERIGSDFPAYEDFVYENACAVVAGAVLVGYYDAFYNELIPDFNSKYGYDSNGNIVFMEQTKAVDTMIDTLYKSMGTNIGSKGTSESGFKNGLRQYVQSKNRSVTFSTVMSGTAFSRSAFESAIKRTIPVVLFLKDFLYTLYIGSTNPVTIAYLKGNVGHAAVAYGYRQIKYYRDETVKKWEPVWYNPFRWVSYTERVEFKTDYYARVAFGDGTTGYLNLNNAGSISGGYAVTIR